MNALARRFKALDQDEEGSSLIFAAITFFSLALMIMYVYQMGGLTADRIQIQNAADAAAYSAAQVEANALNSIGQVNDAMTYLNYLNLRYTVDAIVYDTLQQFEKHDQPPATGQYGYVLMGGDGQPYEGPERFKHAARNVGASVGGVPGATRPPLTEGIRWVEDLHFAARAIMQATPTLALRTAAGAAEHNGATHVAFSEDLELAFQLSSRASDGFDERTARPVSGRRTFADPMYRRYGRSDLPVWQVEKVTPSVDTGGAAANQHLPDATGRWFDPRTGGLVDRAVAGMPGEYSQVRLCWRENDWIHEGSGQHGLLPPLSRFRDGAPNGHWHEQHSHYYFDGTTFMELGPHGGISGTTDNPGGHYQPQDDDPSIHNQATDLMFMGPYAGHHYFEPCDTCWAQKRSFGAKWSEIEKSSNRSFSGRDDRQLASFYQLRFTRVFPRPLMMRQPLLRSGVTVMAWAPGGGLGETFRSPDWGMVAVASAAVGYQVQGGGVLPLTALGSPADYSGTLEGGTQTRDVVVTAPGGAADARYRNLFFSDNPSLGVRFGARLVPIAGQFTAHGELAPNGDYLSELLNGGRWYDVASPGTLVAAPPGLTVPTAADRDALVNVVRVNSQASLEAFWH